METIDFDDFLKVELRIGTVISAEVFPEARRPAYILHVDFGEAIGVRKSSVQITDLYTPERLVGRQVMAVINFPPKQVGPIQSQCLVTGFHDADGRIALAVPDAPLPKGAIGECGYLNALTLDELLAAVEAYSAICLAYPRKGRGIEAYCRDVGLEDPSTAGRPSPMPKSSEPLPDAVPAK